MIPYLFVLFFSLALGQETPPQLAPAAPPPEWSPVLKWSGDLRYRLVRKKESIDEDRNYQQLRARLGLRADVNENVQALLRLATATSAVSANQSLGDSKDPGMARRNFGLDLAYIDWKFLKNGSAWVGRTANPFWAPGKAQLIWDSDLAFEGVAFRWDPKDSGIFANIGSTMVSESYQSASGGAPGADSVDTGMAGFQVGYQFKQEDWSAALHFSRYWFLNTHHANITRYDKDAKIYQYSYPHTVYQGNTVFVNDPLLPEADRKYFFSNEYILMNYGIELKCNVMGLEGFAFADFVHNGAASRLNAGAETGVGIKGSGLSLSYAWIKKQADSVIGALTDTDANGGGTDNDGHRISLGVEISKNASVQVHRFQGKRGIDTVKRDFSGMFADLLVSF